MADTIKLGTYLHDLDRFLKKLKPHEKILLKEVIMWIYSDGYNKWCEDSEDEFG